MRAIRLKDAIDLFLLASAATVAPATLRLYRHYLEAFAAQVGDVQLASVTRAMVVSWNPKYHPAGVVRRLMSWATVEAGLLEFNPIAGMKTQRNGSRMRILSRLELVQLMRRSCKRFRRLLLALAESIARPREMRAVRWGDIRTSGSPSWSVADLVAGRCFFRLVRFKGQESRRDRLAVRNIPITRRLGRMLARLYGNGEAADVVIFRNRLRRPWTCNAVRCRFRRLRVAAGIGRDVDGENVVAYSIRHTSATDAVGAGIKGLVLAELMGHSDVRMTQRYVHLRPDHLIEASQRIGEVKQSRIAKAARGGSMHGRKD